VLNRFLKDSEIKAKVQSFKRTASNGNVSVAARLNYAVPATFMAIAGYKTLNGTVEARANAPVKIQTLVLRPRAAYGYWNKEVRIMATRPGGAVEQIGGINYTLTDRGAYRGRGGGNTQFTHGDTIDVGPYTDIWLEMHAREDISGRWHRYNTKDPRTAQHLYVDGRQLQNGEYLNLSKVFPCDTTVSHAWEDSPHRVNWITQDIFFDIETTCSASSNSSVYLDR